MNDDVGKPERVTQNRIIDLFEHQLHYEYIGNWEAREGNSNIEEKYLVPWLQRRGYSNEQIARALYLISNEARNPQRSLYDNNQAVYRLLRYGVDVKTEADKATETVHLVNWWEPEKNDFAIAQEVTLSGDNDRRPDLVLYVNGIAFGIIELKNSRVSIGDGIRQSLSNQQKEFHPWFFATIQLIFAGSDSEGLKYGTTLTPEKFFVSWKEDEADNEGYKIDKYLRKMCEKSRVLELMRDFVLFDNGWKKLPRPHQYFAIKASQAAIANAESGIIWHTQGSGKSIVMVLLAKWILENVPNGRVLIVTDRDELDKQIEGVFSAVGETIRRTTSGKDLLGLLGQATPRLICSLIHKFGPRVDDFDAFIRDMGTQPSKTVGDVFVFVDEAHRTQSGKLHKAMKAIMPSALFVGFTGTPLLKRDAQSTLALFGRYIHAYLFKEAVGDKVILDLVYDARDIDQRIGSAEAIDEWFDRETQGLNSWQKDELKKHWSTMQKVQSSKTRVFRIVTDIVFDFRKNKRLESGLGNAMLVVPSIFDACRYYEIFQNSPLHGQCGLVTSYNPQAKDITREEVGASTETDKQYIYNTYTALLQNVQPKPGKNKAETYEDSVKEKFIKSPATMRILIVVEKLLTGFDAPPCSVLYIDKSMQDHGLFQAICRTNRLDDETKLFGSIVDYRHLFKKVQGAMAVYASELDHQAPGPAPEIFIQERIIEAKRRLEDARETLAYICEPVPPPRGDLQYLHYFCGNTEIESDLEERQPRREALYRATASFVRAIANIADDLAATGYSAEDIRQINDERDHYINLRTFIKRAAHEILDLKPFEADMRWLLDTQIEADAPRRVFTTGDTGLLKLIEAIGIEKAAEEYLGGASSNPEVVAEVIENNIRKTIIKERFTDPAYYEAMSALLNEVIEARRNNAIEYREYLKQIADLARRVNDGQPADVPVLLDTSGKRALWNNLGKNEEVALRLDSALKSGRPDAWRGNLAKERAIQRIIYEVLGDEAEVERIFPIVKAQNEY